jgi:hypothetical protein
MHKSREISDVAGTFSLLSVVTLRQELAGTAGAEAASLVTVGKALVAIHDWTFLLGPDAGRERAVAGLPDVPVRPGATGHGHARARRRPLLFASAIATLFGLYEQVSVWSAIATLPIFAWEASLGIWLIVKGFNPSVIASEKFSPRSDNHSPEIQGVGPTQPPELQKTRTKGAAQQQWWAGSAKGSGYISSAFFAPIHRSAWKGKFSEVQIQDAE